MNIHGKFYESPTSNTIFGAIKLAPKQIIVYADDLCTKEVCVMSGKFRFNDTKKGSDSVLKISGKSSSLIIQLEKQDIEAIAILREFLDHPKKVPSAYDKKSRSLSTSVLPTTKTKKSLRSDQTSDGFQSPLSNKKSKTNSQAQLLEETKQKSSSFKTIEEHIPKKEAQSSKHFKTSSFSSSSSSSSSSSLISSKNIFTPTAQPTIKDAVSSVDHPQNKSNSQKSKIPLNKSAALTPREKLQQQIKERRDLKSDGSKIHSESYFQKIAQQPVLKRTVAAHNSPSSPFTSDSLLSKRKIETDLVSLGIHKKTGRWAEEILGNKETSSSTTINKPYRTKYNHSNAFSTPHHQKHFFPRRDNRRTMDGFANLGNSCYMNAIIVALLHQPIFVNAISSPVWSLVLKRAKALKQDSLSSERSLLENTTSLVTAAKMGDGAIPHVDTSALDVAATAVKKDGSAITDFLDVSSPPLTYQKKADHPFKETSLLAIENNQQPSTTDVDNMEGKSSKSKFVKDGRLSEALLLLISDFYNRTGTITYDKMRKFKNEVELKSGVFSGNIQQDAHEFLGNLINALDEDMIPFASEVAKLQPASTRPTGERDEHQNGLHKLKRPAVCQDLNLINEKNGHGEKKGSSDEEVPSFAHLIPTNHCFHAELNVQICCQGCDYKSQRVEEYRDFSLDLVGNFSKGLKLTDLFDHFFEEEVLELNCEQCSSKVAVKHTSFNKLPGVLVVHLKRFYQPDPYNPGFFQKREVNVAMPKSTSGEVCLDMTKYCSECTINPPTTNTDHLAQYPLLTPKPQQDSVQHTSETKQTMECNHVAGSSGSSGGNLATSSSSSTSNHPVETLFRSPTSSPHSPATVERTGNSFSSTSKLLPSSPQYGLDSDFPSLSYQNSPFKQPPPLCLGKRSKKHTPSVTCIEDDDDVAAAGNAIGCSKDLFNRETIDHLPSNITVRKQNTNRISSCIDLETCSEDASTVGLDVEHMQQDLEAYSNTHKELDEMIKHAERCSAGKQHAGDNGVCTNYDVGEFPSDNFCDLNEDGGVWHCSHCTLENKQYAEICEACDHTRERETVTVEAMDDDFASTPPKHDVPIKGEQLPSSSNELTDRPTHSMQQNTKSLQEINALRGDQPPLKAQYSLSAVVHHKGHHANSGHYITSVKKFSIGSESRQILSSSPAPSVSSNRHPVTSEWVQFDDALSTPMSSQSVADSAASDGYILFFTTSP